MAHALSLSSPSCFYHHHHHNIKAPLSIFSPSLNRPNTTKKLTAIPQLISTAATDDPTALALIGGSSVAALATIISLTDPERRRRQQAEQIGGDDKEVVREYFNNNGFQRWKKIYGESTEDVNRVQLDIRTGHAKTVENVINLLKNDKSSLKGVTVCDAGCGTGSLTIPLAMEGAVVLASDISAAMVDEARRKAEEQLLVGHNGNSSSPVMPKFEVKDLESLDGKYDTVVCLDVLIHYPQNKADGMIAHLASLAENRLILSFAPKTIYYNVLKRVGELFPGPSKATRAYLHAEADVERALQKVGWKIRNRDLVTTNFYFSRMVEAIPDRG